jgi:CubicO group peptidase (beta-lactamase class C family)
MHIRRFFLALLVFSFLLSNSHAQIPAQIDNTGLDPALSSKIQSFINDNMTKWQTPGLAIGIVIGDKLVWSGYFGYADIKKKIPVGQSTIFRIGSISKIFTAVAMMQLLDNGLFAVDDPIDDYGPYSIFKQKYDCCPRPTFMNVFTHTSGGGEFRSFKPEPMVLPAGSQRRSLEELYQPGILTLICPDEKWAYCNYCVGALGLVLENMTGSSFQDYTDNKIFATIGMGSSSFYENDRIIAKVAQGYRYTISKFSPVALQIIEDVPAGNVYSTVDDMSKFMLALLNGGSSGSASIIHPDRLQYMLTRHYELDSRLSAMGINFFLRDVFGYAVAEHGGSMPGFISEMLLLPREKLGIIALNNAESLASYEAAYGIMRMLVNYTEPQDQYTSAKDLWPKLTGDYVSPEPEFFTDARFLLSAFGKYKVRIKRGALVLETGRPGVSYRLQQVAQDDHFFYRVENSSLSPVYVVFKPGPDGRARSIIIDLNEYVRKNSGQIVKPCHKDE